MTPVLVIDFGSQVTQLIVRRVRESGVYCEVVPFDKAESVLAKARPSAVILSGGPRSVGDPGSPRAPDRVFKLGVPVLGICYGQQTMVAQLGGRVEPHHKREFGRAEVEISGQSPLLEGLWPLGTRDVVWMSHGDRVTALPPGFHVLAQSENAPFALIADETRRFYGTMFHPEVVHTPRGAELLRNFTQVIAGIPPDWNMRKFRVEAVRRIREQVGKGRV
ncbi:MAG TPA: glutamine-hydrolyzing GMP synthase, partial [Micropepsaceae bacterium]|nr:glutamine-hydrolyzing GMP synthase [Micropepsaceae bacterium]